MKKSDFRPLSEQESKNVVAGTSCSSSGSKTLYECYFNGNWDGVYVDEGGKAKAERNGGRCRAVYTVKTDDYTPE